MTQGMTAVSTEAAQQFAEEAGIPPGRFVVLGSGVDTSRFQPPNLRRSGGRIILGCVARLDPIKAHDVLIDAFARVVNRGEVDLELRLLGDGPCRPALERQVRAGGLEERVRFLGTVGDVPERLRDLDVFVLTSHREGRPTSIMEAMAAGLPVIATRVGSIPGLVAHQRTGLLVEPRDVEALAQAIESLAVDPGLRLRLAEEARRVAVAELSLESMIAQYASFYRDLANPGRSARQ
jgi:glycosyltransferase involved in cell wall biosynthesis